MAPQDSLVLALTERQWTIVVEALQESADDGVDQAWSQDCSDLAVLLRSKIDAALPGTYGNHGPNSSDEENRPL